jgi:SET domain-containing protein
MNSIMYKPLPDELTIKKSPISGLGLFACKAIPAGSDLGITHIVNHDIYMHIIRTPLGGFINHSETPNCIIEKEEDIWYLETTDDITDNEELTVRYFPEFLNF